MCVCLWWWWFLFEFGVVVTGLSGQGEGLERKITKKEGEKKPWFNGIVFCQSEQHRSWWSRMTLFAFPVFLQ